jgi:spermidine synthase
MVEIDEIVVEMSKKYFPNHSQGAFNDPRVTLIIDDAAAFLKKTNDRFDVILTDSTDPTGPGEHLFTEEFYQNCKNHLEKDGILVTQSGVPFMQPTGIYNMQNMLSTFFEAVDFYQATIPTYVGGPMVFGFATNAQTNSFDEIKRRATTVQNQLHYWTPKIHQAAFLLPPFLQALRTNKKSQIS